MLEILMYLFEKFMDNTAALNADLNFVLKELEQAGFDLHEIKQAFLWLEGLHAMQHNTFRSSVARVSLAMRHYTMEETEKLGMEGQGFLQYLENLTILNCTNREIVIDRLMAFEDRTVPLRRIKWVVLFVLFHQPEQCYALSVLQEMVLSEVMSVIH